MKAKLFQNAIVVKPSPLHGYGVFAEKDISKDEIVEECYTLLTTESVDDLSNYYFKAGEKSALPMGYGCIYNHSDTPNVSYEFHFDTQLMIFKASMFIKKGEEIFSSYGQDWFSSRNIKPMEISLLKKWHRSYSSLGLKTIIICASYFALLFLLNFLSR